MKAPKVDKVCARTPRTRNILAVWSQATNQEIADGMSWYEDANLVARTLDPVHPEKGAGVLAALSPRMPWDRNIMLAIRAFEDGHATGALSLNCAKADRIMAGEDPLSVLGGDKVRAFYGAIVDPAGDDVVIDRHAFDIAVGRVTNDVTRASLSRKGEYARFAHHYVLAARAISETEGIEISACQLQAVTWTTWRRLKGITD